MRKAEGGRRLVDGARNPQCRFERPTQTCSPRAETAGAPECPCHLERPSPHVTSSERSESRGPLKSTRAACCWVVPRVLWARERWPERASGPLQTPRRSYNSGDFSMRSLRSLSRNDMRRRRRRSLRSVSPRAKPRGLLTRVGRIVEGDVGRGCRRPPVAVSLLLTPHPLLLHVTSSERPTHPCHLERKRPARSAGRWSREVP
jgi:hypothetical protein